MSDPALRNTHGCCWGILPKKHYIKWAKTEQDSVRIALIFVWDQEETGEQWDQEGWMVRVGRPHRREMKQMNVKCYLMLWGFLLESENMELFSVPGFSPQSLARGSRFQHSPLKLYNTTAVQMGTESKPAAPLHPPANYLQRDRMLIKIPP